MVYRIDRACFLGILASIPAPNIDLAQASTRLPKASFSPKRATMTLRLCSHQHTRPVNCLLAKASHQHCNITLTLHPSRHMCCWSCRCTEGFMTRRWGLILPVWRCPYEPQVEASTQCGAVSTREATPLSSQVCLICRCTEGFQSLRWDLILPGWWLCGPENGVAVPCGVVSTRATAVFVPGLSELQI